MKGKIKTLKACVSKALLVDDYPDVQLNDNEDMIGIASIEIEDSTGDVVKIAGISVKDYHNPPESHLKILTDHRLHLANGDPAVIGRVERIIKTTDANGVPALLFTMSFAKEKSTGELTKLSSAYKELMPAYIDSFSIGMVVDKFSPNNAGGITIEKCRVYEISAVTVPANARANAVSKALKSAAESEDDLIFDDDSQVLSLSDISKIECLLSEKLDKHLKTVESRLDSLESTFVAMTTKASKSGNHQTSLDSNALKAITDGLTKLKQMRI